MTKSQVKIINAFLFLINQESVLDITNDEIIKTAKVARGTFYHYFQCKDDIIKAAAVVINHQLRNNFIKRYRELGTPEMTPELLIQLFSETIFPIISEYRTMIWVLHSSDVNELLRNEIGQYYLRTMRKLFPDQDEFNLKLFNNYVYMLMTFWVSPLMSIEQHEFQREFQRSLTQNMIETLK
ncbi:TetR/AcrR family transcriptional regulator [Lactobacillaceae bacterium Melli_B4]